MNETTEASAPTIVPVENDLEAKVAALEAEKAKVAEERDNYKKAYLKEAEKKRETGEENDEERLRSIAREELSNSRLAEITREQNEIIQKALKENKELKLAHLNKTNTPPTAIGTHSEGTPVRDTLVTPEQLAAFKAKGWSDQDIERYKKNLQKNGR